MRQIYVTESTRSALYQLKATLQAKSANEVIEYLLFKDKKEKKE